MFMPDSTHSKIHAFWSEFWKRSQVLFVRRAMSRKYQQKVLLWDTYRNEEMHVLTGLDGSEETPGAVFVG